MTGIVDWAGSRARMVLAFIAISLIAGAAAYVGLPKEGEPDIEIPALFVSVPFPGISAEDAETLLVQPMETELSDLDGLKTMSTTAAEGYAGAALEFEFGWDKTKIIADVRDKMNTVEADFPAGADKYTVNEINFSEFPIIIVNLSGDLPERTLVRVGKDLQDRLEGLEPVLEAVLAGYRDEMVEVTIDPLRLEAYNVTAPELINVVTNNNQLIAAGEVTTPNGTFAVKIPSSFSTADDIYNLPVKTNGDRVVTLGDLADIRLTFEDREGTARFNGETTVALQVVKRKGYNIIDTAAAVRETIDQARSEWPEQLQAAVSMGTSNDQSRTVGSMVSQLEGSVLTAIALVMIVVLGALGTRSALLVGFAIPTSFLLCFVLLGAMGITISNIVMFGLILAVGMLVDGAIVVVEYADRRIKEGVGPMHAFTDAAKRMFWPIVSSTATTLCAFLPMLFWPGVAGEFMGMLPVTLIFVLSASLIVALIYLPVLGGVFGRGSRIIENISAWLKRTMPWWARALLVLPMFYLLFLGLMQILNPSYLLGDAASSMGITAIIPGALLFFIGAVGGSAAMGAAAIQRKPKAVKVGKGRTPFGRFIQFIAGNPIMPLVTIGVVIFVVATTFSYFGANNKGVEFFVDAEPEQAIIYVRQRGNLSLEEKDEAVRTVENMILGETGVESVFAFAGAGGLNQNDGGAGAPRDSIGQAQIELTAWEKRPTVKEDWIFGLQREVIDPLYDGNAVLDRLQAKLDAIPGIRVEILNLSRGPASAKPVHLRIKGEDWEDLLTAAETARAKFDETPALIDIDDTMPLPGIDWQIEVDVQKAGRYGTDVATVGGMVQLVTRGLLLDTMRVDSSDEEIEIRVRFPEDDRVLSTLDSLRIRTSEGLVPLSNFVTRKPVAKLAQIDRVDQVRYFDVKAGVAAGWSSISLPPEDEETTGETLAFVSPVSAEEVAEGAAFDLTKTVSGTQEYYKSEVLLDGVTLASVQEQLDTNNDLVIGVVNANERITALTEWLNQEGVFPETVEWEWTGDQEDQAESADFLMKAFAGALGLMFVILLAQFNSFYNSVLVLIAVVLSTTGVLIGMIVMDQAFSIIMTGTGIVALAGIVVNNNIVLIDTYQEYSRYMPQIEAIVRTAQNRIRPVLLTTITTMAGLAPMMFGLSLDFINGGYSIDSPTALWWKQLATAVVFGLGIATVLTLVFTPSLLAVRVWAATYVRWIARALAAMSMGRGSRAAQDWALQREARHAKSPQLDWGNLLEPDGKDETLPNLDELESALDPKDEDAKDAPADETPEPANDSNSEETPPKPKGDGPLAAE
ncbi:MULTISPECIES: efflux RND transporter permease subunit [Halocynthiibacter]|uniref:Efflux RND transporter permease subunit n=1 Tax=Halocynthiibacter halioticoli TaxID=2986804 RepID=A0AAE3IXN2_9RHOB|nr:MULTISPECIES: efflux RND transporter permease subunit [Halocynthiibacter]MCV6824035.1 efflux RND transporter permease subunit [Halocynthiibacter halioticoli]MCW4057036.1 efflux RND transporter permease subunit [Halocynthiibacter sp. SDUM655004]